MKTVMIETEFGMELAPVLEHKGNILNYKDLKLMALSFRIGGIHSLEYYAEEFNIEAPRKILKFMGNEFLINGIMGFVKEGLKYGIFQKSEK